MNWTDVLIFIGGAIFGATVVGHFYWRSVQSLQRINAEFRIEQHRRLDELAEWHHRNLDEARREVGLPPRVVS